MYEVAMLVVVAEKWWVAALRGVIAIVFGVLALAVPGAALAGLVLFFGAYAFADGILAIWTAISMRGRHGTWAWLLLEGITGIVIGLMVFFWPAITAVALLFLIAAWAIVTGVFEIAAAIRLRREIQGEWLLALTGMLSIVFGVLLAVWPGAGLVAVVWLIGIYAIMFGVAMVALGMKLRRTHTKAAAAA
jgi:uncharacterized membrane protein HdeD (DUF308 family)